MSRRALAIVLMLLVAGSLAVMSALHLGGVLKSGSRPSRESAAGIAESLICVVMVAGAVALARFARRPPAVAAVLFAIAGFLVGLSFTVRGGGVVDVAYHAGTLPLLLLILLVLRADRSPRLSS